MIKQKFKFKLTNFNSPKLFSFKCLKMNNDYTVCSKLKDSNLTEGKDVMKENILSVEDELKVEDKLKKKINQKRKITQKKNICQRKKT